MADNQTDATAAEDKVAEAQTVTTADREGNEFEVPVGADGKNPVSPNNPPAKSILPEDVEKIQEEQAKVEERQALLAEGVSVSDDQPSQAKGDSGTDAGASKTDTSSKTGTKTSTK